MQSNKKGLLPLFLYHLMRPIIDLKLALVGLRNYPHFLADFIRYRGLEKNRPVPFGELHPKLHDRVVSTPVDSHYFYQQLWVFGKVLRAKPASHVDLGSSYELSGYLAQVLPVTFVDLRPIKVELANLKILRADITRLPFASGSVESLSCLHVIEHIGLGRYGDKLDPAGPKRAFAEIARILARYGRAYITLPIGRERTCFNAHRVFRPQTILAHLALPELKLLEFSAVDDQGNFCEKADLEKLTGLDYGLGMFEFEKQ